MGFPESDRHAEIVEGISHAVGKAANDEKRNTEEQRIYAGCDLLLVPSTAETFGMVYLEAMSQGVPVLYTRGQGFDGQFPEGEIGYSVICGDIEQQAQRLVQVIEDYPARSARCAERAGAYAWPLVARRWSMLYQSII